MRKSREEINIKIIKYAIVATIALTIIVFGILLYSKKLNNEAKSEALVGKEEISNIVNNINSSKENTESASSSIGKNINEATNELKNNASNELNSKNTTNTNTASSNNATLTTKNINSTEKNKTNTSEQTEQTSSNTTQAAQTTNTELQFIKPVDGEIVKEFAMDNLVYSNTLQEWTVHTGIDIKADKTTVVKAAEAGTVKTIKNDPRYGLTIIVEHENGFQTVYANLLTSEFVVEGEKVEKGQSLGTVGNTAAFEIADEPHLHFEILKDSAQVNPNIYIK